MYEPTTESIPVVTDPFEIIAALCEAEEWELARRIARNHDEQGRDMRRE
jgi:hypothetical protein